MAAEPKVAVVGRQNVGKSTLVNRLVGRKLAIAHESAGVTRDRVETPARWGDRSFVLVDTGGFIRKARGIDERVVRQAGRAMETADLALLVVDSTTGIQEEDASLARSLRRSGVRRSGSDSRRVGVGARGGDPGDPPHVERPARDPLRRQVLCAGRRAFRAGAGAPDGHLARRVQATHAVGCRTPGGRVGTLARLLQACRPSRRQPAHR